MCITEICFEPNILECEILPKNDFVISPHDRSCKVDGGVLIAVRDSLQSCRKKDLETVVEMLACELRPRN